MLTGFSRVIVISALLSVSSLASATGSHTTPTPATTNTPSTTSSSTSSAVSQARSRSHAESTSFAAAEQAQKQKQQQAQQQAQLNNQESSQGTEVNIDQSANGIGALYLPPNFVVDCGAGVGAGAQSGRDAGVFSFTWTTGACFAFKSGVNFAAIGDWESACILWLDVNRKAFKRQHYTPDCAARAAQLRADALMLWQYKYGPKQNTSTTSIAPNGYMRIEEVLERERRIREKLNK